MSYWIKSLNVVENVAMPLLIDGIKKKRAIERARNLLADLKIEKLANQIPGQLSGGEQQRIGFARALISNPHIIIADEPTGNLDSSAADEIMSIFDTLNTKMKKTILFIILLFTVALSAKDGSWVNLFNGKNLEGWKEVNGTAEYKVENGAITGITKVNSPNSFLATEKEFDNFS